MSIISNVKDFNKCCRCCLLIVGNMRPIFDASVGQMYNSIIPNQASEFDGYPQHACQRCILKLSSAYCFQQTVIKNQQTLLQLYESNLQNNETSNSIGSPKIFVRDDLLMKAAVPDVKNNEQFNIINNEPVESNIDVGVNEITEDIDLFSHETRLEIKIKDTESDGAQPHQAENKVDSERVESKYHCLNCNKPLEEATGNKVQIVICESCSVRNKRNTKKKGKTIKLKSESPHLCNICGKIYKLRTSLLKHLRFHRSKNLVNCKYCDKAFLYVKELHIHEKAHLGMKPFKCNKCNVRFTQLGSLNKHSLGHSNNRPYKCSDCNKMFKQIGHYRAHVRIHTGEKPFKCITCGKQFRWRNSLRVHEKSHDKVIFKSIPDGLTECTTCDQWFPNSDEMLEHCKITHENVYIEPQHSTCTLNVQNLITKIIQDSL